MAPEASVALVVLQVAVLQEVEPRALLAKVELGLALLGLAVMVAMQQVPVELAAMAALAVRVARTATAALAVAEVQEHQEPLVPMRFQLFSHIDCSSVPALERCSVVEMKK